MKIRGFQKCKIHSCSVCYRGLYPFFNDCTYTISIFIARMTPHVRTQIAQAVQVLGLRQLRLANVQSIPQLFYFLHYFPGAVSSLVN